MDDFLLEYLKSGKAWLLVGSGPSAAIGYPSWKDLAIAALELCRVEAIGQSLDSLKHAIDDNKFPEALEEAAQIVGMPLLLHHLSTILPAHPDGSSEDNIYTHVAKWPVSVYLTTNFDHEISRHLSLAGEGSFIDYSNSTDHMSRLLPDKSGMVVYLHGDLRSDSGLVLTAAQYKNILTDNAWLYWRVKMTSIFQMNRVIVIGHSLTDPHIKHVLEAAKVGSGVVQPVCWIAPDVSTVVAREYLEKYRIRVISYDNRDGTHRNLTKLVETLSDFVPPRLTVQMSKAVADTTFSPLGRNAAAPGFFVFSKLSTQSDFEEKRTDVLVAALHAAVPQLKAVSAFSIQQALEYVGWPKGSAIPNDLAGYIGTKAVAEGVLVQNGTVFSVAPQAEKQVQAESNEFEHLRERFQISLQNRLRRDFPSLPSDQVTEVALDIDSALAGFFLECGLTLASTLPHVKEGTARPTIPSSIVGFVNQASAKYNDHLRRQAFSTAAIECFTRADAVEREYLGRVSQGFIGFHLLGVFGDAASERLGHMKDTVWIVDSSVQIPSIALGSTAHLAFKETFQRLHKLGLHFFSSDGLFEETAQHLWFANMIVTNNGQSSPEVLSAAKGEVPYRKGNLFLEGFINWQASGNPTDWKQYLIAVSGQGDVGKGAVRAALQRVNIQSIAFSDWPGFRPKDSTEATQAVEKILDILNQRPADGIEKDQEELRQKANPEAEALLIVTHERDGAYHMLSKEGEHSSSWFLSKTGVLNKVGDGQRITMPPEQFLRLASTLIPIADGEATERAFGTLLWTIAQSGVTVLDDRVATEVFGGIIDQAQLEISEQHAAYDQVLADKYCTSVENLMATVRPSERPLAALQLANEIVERESAMRVGAQAVASAARDRASRAEAELLKVEKFRNKLQAKQHQAKARKRKSRSHKKRK